MAESTHLNSPVESDDGDAADAHTLPMGPPQPPRRILWPSVIAALLAMGLGLGGYVVLPKFIAIFVDFDAALPALTVALITPNPIVWPVVFAPMAGLLLAKDFVLSGRNCRLINVIAIVCLIVMACAASLAILLPLVSLIQNVAP